MLVFGVRVFTNTEVPRGSYIHRELYIGCLCIWLVQWGSIYVDHKKTITLAFSLSAITRTSTNNSYSHTPIMMSVTQFHQMHEQQWRHARSRLKMVFWPWVITLSIDSLVAWLMQISKRICRLRVYNTSTSWSIRVRDGNWSCFASSTWKTSFLDYCWLLRDFKWWMGLLVTYLGYRGTTFLLCQGLMCMYLRFLYHHVACCWSALLAPWLHGHKQKQNRVLWHVR